MRRDAFTDPAADTAATEIGLKLMFTGETVSGRVAGVPFLGWLDLLSVLAELRPADGGAAPMEDR